MSTTFPGESAEYRAARDRLLEQEIELRRAMEVVAAARRELPPGGPIPEDYVFQGAGADGTPTEVRLSELFVYGRGAETVGGSYYFLDLTALGRQEDWEEPQGRATEARGAIPDFSS